MVEVDERSGGGEENYNMAALKGGMMMAVHRHTKHTFGGRALRLDLRKSLFAGIM